MLFFQIDFIVYFLIPLIVLVAALKLVGLQPVLPWVASGASFYFLYQNSSLSVFIAMLSICINYFGARLLLNNRDPRILTVAVAANIAVLAYFKYSVFILHGVLGRGGTWGWHLALPLGISFYTFQQIAFLCDVYRGEVTSFTLRTYALFKLFFPQFIAGPIVHFERVRASYERWPTFNARSIRFGLTIIAIGFAKKMAGDYFADIANALFAKQASLNGYEAWVAMLAFTFQIYFDFSGYSDMAVGLARLFGVSLPFNFNSPYKSRNIIEFWRRWHITLSNWLRDYLYIPLGGNRHGKARMYVALMTTMLLGGLWHGAGWNFVLWGAAHGVALIWCRVVPFRLPARIAVALTFLFTALTWILFRSPTFDGAVGHYAHLLQFSQQDIGVELWRLLNVFVPIGPFYGAANRPEQLSQVTALLAAAIFCFSLPNSQSISLWISARHVRRFALSDVPAMAAVVMILSFAFISPDTANAFIYFAF